MKKLSKAEQQFTDKYWKEVNSGKFPVICSTADAVVFMDGKVLLVKRKNFPGKGTWANAGGFLNQYEKAYDACIRECSEETNITLEKGWLFDKDVFDAPHRAPGGRIITHAHAFIIPIGNKRYFEQYAKAGDDAAEIRWVGMLDFVKNYVDICHQDHYDIVCRFGAGFLKSVDKN